jgi:putative transcriptional regulator
MEDQMANGEYHYTESGLDSVYLVNGYEIVETQDGRSIVIQDLDGLHRAIGRNLVAEKKRLNGKEARFLRTEMFLSQSLLARLLQEDEQTVARWEKGHTKIRGPADVTLRLLYLEHIGGDGKISDLLRDIADLDDDIDRNCRFSLEETSSGWDLAA